MMLVRTGQGPVASGREAGQDEVDDRWWRALTEKANSAFRHKDCFAARALYGEALAEAERLFQLGLQGAHRAQVPVAVIYVIASHNLAELELWCGRERAAEVNFRRACDRLMEGAGDVHAPLAVRAGCMQHLKPALSSLVGHYRASGQPESRVTDLLASARKAVMSAFHAVRHAEIASQACGHCAIALN